MRRAKTFLIIAGALFTVLAGSCSKEFEEHYNPSGRMDKNIVTILSDDQEFAEFVKIIDKLDLRKTLGEGAIYTCLAPSNDQVKEYFKSKGYASVDEVPEMELREYLNYHFINGMYYKYDIEKRYTSAIGGLNPTRATYYTTRAEAKIPAKSIRFYTPSFFALQQDDFKSLYNNLSGSGFMVENAEISDTKYDIDASNGVIHALKTPLDILPRTDKAIASDSQIGIFNKWLESQVTYTLGPKDEFGWVDTTLIKSYSSIRNLADESIRSTIFAPTDEAIREYFQPYLDDLYGTVDSIPPSIISEILKANVLADPWFKSDIARNNPELRTNTYPQVIIKIAPIIVGSVLASNSVIFKVNKLIEPPKLHSVEGGVYMKRRYYSQWAWMFENTNLESGLTDGLYYQHSPKTILLQPDNVWGSPLAPDMTTTARDIRYNECRTGIINMDIRQDGGFRKRFYPTEFGYILFDSNKFYDYTGKSVSLLTTSPVWERVNGSIYEIDGFLTPMDKVDVAQTVYSLITKDTQLSNFKAAIDKVGLSGELNLTGFFSYTVFAPTNAALQAAGINVTTMAVADLLNFVNAHIVPNRYIFSDGVLQGSVPNKNGANITASGSWDTFAITGSSGKTVKPTVVNIQGNNGVIHKIAQTL